MENIGTRIKELRTQRNETQLQFSAHLAITHSRLSEYENSARIPSVNTLTKLADVTGCSLDWLVLGKPRP